MRHTASSGSLRLRTIALRRANRPECPGNPLAPDSHPQAEQIGCTSLNYTFLFSAKSSAGLPARLRGVCDETAERLRAAVYLEPFEFVVRPNCGIHCGHGDRSH